jgi:thiol-disulfide isomerase/thioredoxin
LNGSDILSEFRLSKFAYYQMKLRPGIVLILLTTLSCSCSPQMDEADLGKIYFAPDGSEQHPAALQGQSGTVFIFLSPECPLCINYTLTVKELQQEFEERGIGFVAVYPGTYHTAEEVSEFVNNFQLSMPAIMDPQLTFTKACRATVTPEAVLIDKNGQIVYRGAIDDWSYATGKKKRQADKFFLNDAIDAFLSGNKPEPAVTEPVGCFIE